MRHHTVCGLVRLPGLAVSSGRRGGASVWLFLVVVLVAGSWLAALHRFVVVGAEVPRRAGVPRGCSDQIVTNHHPRSSCKVP